MMENSETIGPVEVAQMDAPGLELEPQSIVQPLAPQRDFTPRSRRSLHDEAGLKNEINRWNSLIGAEERTLEMADDDKQGAMWAIEQGDSYGHARLTHVIEKREIIEKKLTEFRSARDKAQSRLDEYRASMAAAAAGRLEIQNKLARGADDLPWMYEELQRLMRQTLDWLNRCEETGDSMGRQASQIGLDFKFDVGIPASLRRTLSLEVAEAAICWRAKFVGDEQGLKPYVVCDPTFEPEETLARKALYKFGETVFLLEEEAVPFLRNDRPAPSGREWDCLPPTLMTLGACPRITDCS